VASATEQQLLALLAARGDHAKPDGRLASVAQWAIAYAVRRQSPDVAGLDAVTRRVGFVGPEPALFVLPGRTGGGPPIAPADLKARIDSIPSNIPITRYGIAILVRGNDAAIGIATDSLEVTLASVPKHLAVHDTLKLSGTLGDRFQGAHVAITLPDGQVRTWDSATRRVKGGGGAAEASQRRACRGSPARRSSRALALRRERRAGRPARRAKRTRG